MPSAFLQITAQTELYANQLFTSPELEVPGNSGMALFHFVA